MKGLTIVFFMFPFYSFKVLGSMEDETYIELLDSGLRNDNNSGKDSGFL